MIRKTRIQNHPSTELITRLASDEGDDRPRLLSTRIKRELVHALEHMALARLRTSENEFPHVAKLMALVALIEKNIREAENYNLEMIKQAGTENSEPEGTVILTLSEIEQARHNLLEKLNVAFLALEDTDNA